MVGTAAAGHASGACSAAQVGDVALRGARNRRLRAGRWPRLEGVVDAVEREWLDCRDDTADGLLVERNLVRGAIHERKPTRIGADTYGFASEERARSLRPLPPGDHAAPRGI